MIQKYTYKYNRILLNLTLLKIKHSTTNIWTDQHSCGSDYGRVCKFVRGNPILFFPSFRTYLTYMYELLLFLGFYKY